MTIEDSDGLGQGTARSGGGEPRSVRKMETLGRLTAGVAHDFSNLLQVIGGYAEIIQTGVETGTIDAARLHRASEAIREATAQAASLTRGLLDFTGDEMADGVGLDILVIEFGEVARRMLGDAFVLETVLPPGLWHARIDAARSGIALLRLILDARDALPAGGTVTVRTENVVIDDREAARADGVAPGRYVALQVGGRGDTPLGGLAEDVEPPFAARLLFPAQALAASGQRPAVAG